MSKAGKQMIAAAAEALSVARGDIAAAAIYHNGHRYVPEAVIKSVLRRAERILSLSPDQIRLKCGEMSAQEMRTVQAVLGWGRAAIRVLADAHLNVHLSTLPELDAEMGEA